MTFKLSLFTIAGLSRNFQSKVRCNETQTEEGPTELGVLPPFHWKLILHSQFERGAKTGYDGRNCKDHPIAAKYVFRLTNETPQISRH